MSEYNNKIIEYYNNPINEYNGEQIDFSVMAENLTCGDEVSLFFKLNGDRIEQIYQKSEGCAFCVASACAVTEILKHKTMAEVKQMDISSVNEFLGIDPAKSREKCVELSLSAIKKL